MTGETFILTPVIIPKSFIEAKPRPRLYKAKRNALCPCGSGKKFKKCCIDKLLT